MTAGEKITVQVGSIRRRGVVVELPDGATPSTVHDAIRTGDTDGVSVDCPPPGPVYEHVGYIHGEMGIRPRTALARAGRSKGLTTEFDECIERLDGKIAAIDAELAEQTETDTTASRRAVAQKQTATTELREAAEAARGRLRACRDNDLDTDAALEALESAVRALSEHETAVAAAREQLARARSQRQAQRDLKERRLHLEDRRANLQRDARAALVDRLRGEFTDALRSVSGATTEDPFDATPVDSALAVACIAKLDAPVLLDADRFDSAQGASDWLAVPIIDI